MVAAVPLLGGPAVADPSRETLNARRRLDKLNLEVSLATERYDESRIRLAAASRAAAAAQARVAAKERDLAAAQADIAELAVAAYRGGGIDDLIQMLTSSDPQSFLDRAATLDVVSRRREQSLRSLAVAQRALRIERSRAASALGAATRLAADLDRTRASIERAVAQQQQLLARLESADARRERLAREAAARRAALLAAARERARQASRTRTAPVYAGAASQKRAAFAVREAYRQLGKPYRWGAAGPDTFDCSGLTMWAWAKAGVALPHSSRMQFGEGRHVSRDELAPGDLVFFGSPIHHVGIYVGNGSMVSAPQTGDVVKVSSALRDDYVGAVRL